MDDVKPDVLDFVEMDECKLNYFTKVEEFYCKNKRGGLSIFTLNWFAGKGKPLSRLNKMYVES